MLKNPYVLLITHFLCIFVIWILWILFSGELEEGLSFIITGAIIFLLTAILGPVSVIIEPVFGAIHKLVFIIAISTFIALIVWGIRKRRHWWGHAISLLGTLGWVYCGMLGMNA